LLEDRSDLMAHSSVITRLKAFFILETGPSC
jgi:hypothetical protein